jgi:hypothetical protein
MQDFAGVGDYQNPFIFAILPRPSVLPESQTASVPEV